MFFGVFINWIFLSNTSHGDNETHKNEVKKVKKPHSNYHLNQILKSNNYPINPTLKRQKSQSLLNPKVSFLKKEY